MPTDAGTAEGTTSPPSVNPMFQFANSSTGVNGSKPLRYNRLMKGPEAAEWTEASAKEIDRLVWTTKTMHFIRPENKPHDRLASYYNLQCSIKHGKDKRVRGTYGGDRSDYTGAVSANTAVHETVMVLLNATIFESTAFFTTPTTSLTVLREYTAYRKPRHSPQRLDAHLAAHDGYHESSTPCLYKHITRPIMFTLVVVDDFGIKAHDHQEHLDHLRNTLCLLYAITSGDGSKYLGMILE